MSDGCKVSVVMAVYNSAECLPAAVESILGQSLKEIELICVDDGSTDNSLSILQHYEQADRRVRVYQNHDITDGAGAARNMGIMHAKGKYLSILDADDFFEGTLLETVYRKATQSHADIVLYDAYLYDTKLHVDSTVDWLLCKHMLPLKTVFSPDENADHIFQMTIGAAWNAMFSRDFVLSHQLRFESLHHADDLGFVYLAFALAGRIAVVQERLLHYRKNRDGSQSAGINRYPETGYEAMRRLKEQLEAYGIYAKYRKSFVNKALDYALFYLDSITDAKSFHILYSALQSSELENLDILSLPKDSFFSLSDVIRRDMISTLSPAAYLLQWYQGKQRDTVQSILSSVPLGSRLALYGAGTRGWELYCMLLQGRQFKVCAWVDKNYQKIGFPVQQPEHLTEVAFDYVLITMKNETVARQVREYLLKRKIPKDKIIWWG